MELLVILLTFILAPYLFPNKKEPIEKEPEISPEQQKTLNKIAKQERNRKKHLYNKAIYRKSHGKTVPFDWEE